MSDFIPQTGKMVGALELHLLEAKDLAQGLSKFEAQSIGYYFYGQVAKDAEQLLRLAVDLRHKLEREPNPPLTEAELAAQAKVLEKAQVLAAPKEPFTCIYQDEDPMQQRKICTVKVFRDGGCPGVMKCTHRPQEQEGKADGAT